MVIKIKTTILFFFFVVFLFSGNEAIHAEASLDLVTNHEEIISFKNFPINDTSSYKGIETSQNEETICVKDYFIQEETTIGRDDREKIINTKIFPYSACVFVTATYRSGETYIGSGSMISPDTVLTAGHVIYNKKLKQWPRSVTVYPGVNGSHAPFGHSSSSKLASLLGWTRRFDPQYDIGMIKLDCPLGITTGWFGLTSIARAGLKVTSTGYPGDKALQTMWTNSGEISSVTPNHVYYRLDTFGGQSGSAVYNSANQIVAVHAYAQDRQNFGTRTNAAIINWIKNDLKNMSSFPGTYGPILDKHFRVERNPKLKLLTDSPM
ncbi:trypsin-like serine peptidase [Enterococcus hulanensis]|uniref:trypsin-like serine peptidase n=1 Tax=Enterococcus hulanensis TaxID=2559929 RepID=UPI0010F99D43|nr:serine protease [Enterococcus hulanensis]